jgi:DNA-binding response OmpR family regulator
VPVIVITARSNQHEQARKMRMDALMEKPLDLHLLLQTIRQLLLEPDEAHIQRVTAGNFGTALLNRASPTEDGGSS